MIYLVYTKYSKHSPEIWDVYGYFTDKTKAEKYIAKRNYINECARAKHPNPRDKGYIDGQGEVFFIQELPELAEDRFDVEGVGF